MTVNELISLNQMITDIRIEVRINGTALLDALFIGCKSGEKPPHPWKVPKERRYVGNMSQGYQREAHYIPKSVNSWDDGKDYYQVKVDRIPKAWRELEVFSWSVSPASIVSYHSPRRSSGISRNVNFHGQSINIVALPSGDPLPDPETEKKKVASRNSWQVR